MRRKAKERKWLLRAGIALAAAFLPACGAATEKAQTEAEERQADKTQSPSDEAQPWTEKAQAEAEERQADKTQSLSDEAQPWTEKAQAEAEERQADKTQSPSDEAQTRIGKAQTGEGRMPQAIGKTQAQAQEERLREEEEPPQAGGAAAWQQELPSRFDLRDKGVILSVPDQGTQGTCWAFASVTALTTSMPQSIRGALSADHMTNKNSFGLAPEDGGDYSMSSAYLLAWQGPVAEEDDPYGDGSSPDGLEPVCHVQTIKILGEKDYEAVKRAVYETGAVQSSLYLPPEGSRESSAFLYEGGMEANHDVVIVGWDDEYPKENFENPPSGDGAFLCMNSWGESFGDGGYFYVSYEDSQIGRHNVSYAGVEPADNYSRIYQTDLCGWTGQMGYGSSGAWFANVYTAAADEIIKAAGFYATKPNTDYRIYVLPLPDEETPGETLGRLSQEALKDSPSAEGSVTEAGFYTVSWEQDIPVKAGSRFIIAAEINSPEAEQPVAVEYKNDGRLSNIDISDGEGYISYDGVRWERAEEKGACNVCLKAYSREKK